MSTFLCWKPVSPERNHLGKDAGLKHALRNGFGSPLVATLTAEHVSYLKGLRDAGLDDAQALIDAIEKYGTIEVFESDW